MVIFEFCFIHYSQSALSPKGLGQPQLCYQKNTQILLRQFCCRPLGFHGALFCLLQHLSSSSHLRSHCHSFTQCTHRVCFRIQQPQRILYCCPQWLSGSIIKDSVKPVVLFFSCLLNQHHVANSIKYCCQGRQAPGFFGTQLQWHMRADLEK